MDHHGIEVSTPILHSGVPGFSLSPRVSCPVDIFFLYQSIGPIAMTVP